jgi:hypothetical protein
MTVKNRIRDSIAGHTDITAQQYASISVRPSAGAAIPTEVSVS